jgi:hypothetical protein
MNRPLTTLERAYELARTGTYSDVNSIERRLTTEGFEGVFQHLAGATIRKALRQISAEAKRQRSE